MRQVDYRFGSADEAIDGLGAIRDAMQSRPHADALAVVFTAGVPAEDAGRLVRRMDEELPEVKRAGISEEMPGLATGAHWHHERHDGRGYPDGLSGEAIPEEGQTQCTRPSRVNRRVA